MPEGLEAEIWRRAIVATVGRRIVRIGVDERVAPPGFAAAVTQATIAGVRRTGKVVVVDTDGPSIGLHFGMTGRIEVDGTAPIPRLAYSSGADRAEWDRLVVWTGRDRTTPAIRMNDPRRLGRVSLDPDLGGLGPDFLTVSADELGRGLGRRRIAVKSALLDQSVVAGLGNMCADEVLWWAGIDPHRPARELGRSEVVELGRVIRRRMPVMLRRGGSDTGTITPEVRAACPPCPRCGTPLRRESIGSRTAVWCPGHQR